MAESSRSSENMSVKNKAETLTNNEDDTEVTMVDYLEEELELEDDVKAVLGAADDKNCSYTQGYVKRQALYACVTCIPLNDEFKPGGICLACSYHCHEGHNLIELYTKRNFRCDCGNGRFKKKCNLVPDRAPINELNKYNQNFRGIYCSCHRPYPDPDDEIPDEMIQCIVCEDWFHGRHLGVPIPEDFSEMICGDCVKSHTFLARYSVKPEEPSVDIESTALGGCKMETLPQTSGNIGTVFFQDNWRSELCMCNLCQAMYEKEGVGFLLDQTDTVQSYEAQDTSIAETQYERGMKALSSLSRVQQVEAIEVYNDMKTKLKEYLRKFADNKKVVRAEDIQEFFSGMEARKRRRLNSTPPHFCH